MSLHPPRADGLKAGWSEKKSLTIALPCQGILVSMSWTGCSEGTAFVLARVVRPPGNNLCDSISFIICQGNYLPGTVGHLHVGLISF